jgi:hypothetical protein
MKAGYGEPLRRFFTEKAWGRSVVDFGHAKQIPKKAAEGEPAALGCPVCCATELLRKESEDCINGLGYGVA